MKSTYEKRLQQMEERSSTVEIYFTTTDHEGRLTLICPDGTTLYNNEAQTYREERLANCIVIED